MAQAWPQCAPQKGVQASLLQLKPPHVSHQCKRHLGVRFCLRRMRQRTKLKCFAVKDEFTRECLVIDVEARMRSRAVIETLEQLCSLHGPPTFLRCDNGPEFISKVIKKWALQRGIQIAYADPGKPWQNGSIESSNSRFRAECLDAELFANRNEARILIEEWRRHYNEVRPHSSLGYRTPTEVRRASLSACQLKQRPAISSTA